MKPKVDIDRKQALRLGEVEEETLDEELFVIRSRKSAFGTMLTQLALTGRLGSRGQVQMELALRKSGIVTDGGYDELRASMLATFPTLDELRVTPIDMCYFASITSKGVTCEGLVLASQKGALLSALCVLGMKRMQGLEEELVKRIKDLNRTIAKNGSGVSIMEELG